MIKNKTIRDSKLMKTYGNLEDQTKHKTGIKKKNLRIKKKTNKDQKKHKTLVKTRETLEK